MFAGNKRAIKKVIYHNSLVQIVCMFLQVIVFHHHSKRLCPDLSIRHIRNMLNVLT
jgi:hypothetical protein